MSYAASLRSNIKAKNHDGSTLFISNLVVYSRQRFFEIIAHEASDIPWVAVVTPC